MNPLFHYNESEPLDPYIYRCYTNRFFFDSSKAAVFAGVYTSRTDGELFTEAGIEPFTEPNSENPDEWLEYKQQIEKMMKALIERKKLTFLKDFELLYREIPLGEKDMYLNYFGMHDKTTEDMIEAETVKIRDARKMKKEKEVKTQYDLN